MSNYANLKSAIQSVIKTNGNNEITGQLLQNELLAMITTLGYGYQFMGVASPDTVPGTPDAKVFYIAYTPGTYTNFGGIVVTGLCVLKYVLGWTKEDIPVSGGGTEFAVETTDLTLVSGTPNKLKFADRSYNTTTPDGLGYKILRKDLTFAEQVTDTNTIYEIRYPFTIAADFQIPSGCVLDFRGGSIDGAFELDLNDCQILGTNEWIGSSLTITGKTASPCFADWFVGTDADKVEKALNMFAVVHLNARDYLITRQIVISHSFALYGDGFQDFFGKTSNTSEISDYSRSRLIATAQMDSILFLKKDSTISSYGSYVLNGVSFTTDASVQRTVDGVKISTPGGPSRPINIHCCNFRSLKYGIYITGSTSASNNSTNTLCVTITSCTIAKNDWGIYVDGHHAVGLLCVDGCNVEQNITGGIYAYDATYIPVFCGIEIKNTLLEGQDTPIYLKADGYVKLNSNYYERTTVTQTIHIEGPSYQAPLIVDIVGEHGSNSTNILYDFKYLVVKSFYIEGPSSLSNGSVIVSANTCYFLELPQITELRITNVVCFPVDSFDDEPDTPFGEVRIQGKQNAIVCGEPAMWSLPASNTLFDNNIPSFTPGKYRAVFYVYVNRLADHYAQFRDITAQQNFSDCSLYAKLFIGRLIKCVTDLDITTTGTGDIRLTYKNRGTDGALLGSSAGLFQSRTDVPKYRPQILSKGTTAQRPLATTFGAGFTYFDETLGRMIVSNGTDWVNMDGTPLTA